MRSPPEGPVKRSREVANRRPAFSRYVFERDVAVKIGVQNLERASLLTGGQAAEDRAWQRTKAAIALRDVDGESERDVIQKQSTTTLSLS